MRATRIASSVGEVLAIGLGVPGVVSGNILLALRGKAYFQDLRLPDRRRQVQRSGDRSILKHACLRRRSAHGVVWRSQNDHRQSRERVAPHSLPGVHR